MCGITGYATLNPDRISRADLIRMNRAITHRGPDDEGIWIGDGVGLGMRRLAIQDLTPAGHQPMHGANSSTLTYNGEVYNFAEVAAELRSHGITTSTRCDTEVVLLALDRWGFDALPRFNGMFAFGHWNDATRTLSLVRDRLGVKPLYYFADDECIVFASELRALQQWAGCPRELDLEALDLYLTYEYVPAPRALLRGVHKLEAGSILTWRDGSYSTRRWWEVEFSEPAAQDQVSIEEAAAECHDLLLDATRLRMISDAPLGALLSGGIDSSGVVGLMGELGQVPSTFSIGFTDASYNELHAAREVATRAGSTHFEEILEANSAAAVETLQVALDEPLSDVSLIPTYLVSKMARKHVTVVISGDGGDEVFAGYDWYRAAAVDELYRSVPAPLRGAAGRILARVPPRPQKKGVVNKLKRFTEGSAGDACHEHLRWQLFATRDQKLRLYQGPLAALLDGDGSGRLATDILASARATTPLGRRQWTDLHLYLPDDILAKVDRASMSVSLEARSPFLDYRVVEFAARLPDAYRMHGSSRKVVLKKALEGVVPSAILKRRKEGFSIPMKTWLRGDLEPLARDLLTSSAAGDLFDTGECRRLLDEHHRGTHNHAHQLWTLMVLQTWRQRLQAPIAD